MLQNDPIQLDENAGGDATEKPAAAATPGRRARFDRATLCLATLVAIAAGGLYAMHHRTSLGLARVASGDESASGIDTLLAGGRESIAALSRSVRGTQALVAQITRHGQSDDEARVRLASSSSSDRTDPRGRDPFRSDLIDALTAPPPPPPPSALDERVVQPAADAAAERERARVSALASARRLQVQSIIHGTSRRACLINGKLYFEGQSVDGFNLRSITPDAVIVASGEFSFELRLRK